MDYTRKKHVITSVEDGKAETFKSINKAKKKSRELQAQGHTVRVIKEDQA